MSGFRTDYVEAALIALLTAEMPEAYGAAVDVQSLGENDFDDEGQLTLQPPCLRVLYAGSDYENLRDNKRLTYQAERLWEILCYESSQRGKADERAQTLALVAAVEDQLAGARLTLQDDSISQPITLVTTRLVVMDEGPVQQFYSITIRIEGVAQFSGANA